MQVKLESYLNATGKRTLKTNGISITAEIPFIPKHASPEKRLELAQIGAFNLIKASGANGITRSNITRLFRAVKAHELNAALIELEKAGAIYGKISQAHIGRPTITLYAK